MSIPSFCVRTSLIAAAVVAMLLGPAVPAQAATGDISVGGVWVCRLTQGAAGLTLEQRVRQIEQRITNVLSAPDVRRGALRVEVRRAGASAAIVAADVTIMTVTPGDAAPTGVSAPEVANQWAARLAQGLRRALPGREVIAHMYTPQSSVGSSGDAFPLGVTWYWRGTLMNDDSRFTPGDPGRYTLRFSPGGRVAVRADCNTGSGTYTLGQDRALAMAVLGMTKMACEPGSLDHRFLAWLGATSHYLRSGGDLILMLKYDSGTMRFSRVPRF